MTRSQRTPRNKGGCRRLRGKSRFAGRPILRSALRRWNALSVRNPSGACTNVYSAFWLLRVSLSIPGFREDRGNVKRERNKSDRPGCFNNVFRIGYVIPVLPNASGVQLHLWLSNTRLWKAILPQGPATA